MIVIFWIMWWVGFWSLIGVKVFYGKGIIFFGWSRKLSVWSRKKKLKVNVVKFCNVNWIGLKWYLRYGKLKVKFV